MASSSLWDNDVNVFGHLTKSFRRRYQNCILPVDFNVFGENVCLMKIFLSFIFGQGAKRKRLPGKKFSPGLSLIHSPTKSKEDLRESFFLENIFFNVSDIERIDFCLVSINFWQGCQNCILIVRSKNFTKIFQLERNSFSSFSEIGENFSALWQKLSPGSSELFFFGVENITFRQSFFSKTFFQMFSDIEWNNAGLLSKFS